MINKLIAFFKNKPCSYHNESKKAYKHRENTCIECGKPVGNTTFSICIKCYNKV